MDEEIMLEELIHKIALILIEAEEYTDGYGMSERRGRAANGQYISRDGGSFADGYSQGYSEGIRMSRHWPGMMPYPERYR